MDALKLQVGGCHYKNMPFQPVELFAKTRCTAFQSNIWKYISRYKDKNGAQDVRKCIHYAQLAIDLECNGNLGYKKIGTVRAFCSTNGLNGYQEKIVMAAAFDNYSEVIELSKNLIEEQYPQEALDWPG